MERSSHKKSKKLWIKIPLIVILVVLLGVGIYAYSIYNNAKQTVNGEMHKKVESIDHELTKKKVKATKPLNILLLGVDERANDVGRSDALMVLSLDPKYDKMQLVSIPRDTRTLIVGKGYADKINHAYAFGGADMSVATVENFLDIEMDYYVRMNMEGLEALIDQLGTITVNNDVAWQYHEYNFTKGRIELDGEKAMRFVRMRKKDPDGGFGRTERQRQVIQGIIDKGASIASISKINGLIDILGDNMTTNLDFDEMKKLLSGYKGTRKNVVSYMMSGSGTKIDGIYYLQVPDSEVEKVHEMIVGVKS
ncbi:transcriptional regulator LytR [Virgibacillus phasianinus]|uniref:Transcriptional regulator LytR n=1 Tax=Virgibacillus phasianinus TaxID=2017483 RepID=A0A220U2H3_9BACI|nr:LCP family protein [Virgibacillus phasianinus]ASK62290.1 transcriptional regulator LytR [Virgibacillus phasianinus]